MDIRKLIEEQTEIIVKEKDAMLHKHRVYRLMMDELHVEEDEFLNNAPIEHSYAIIEKIKKNETRKRSWIKPWGELHNLLRDVMENQLYLEPVNETTIEEVEKFLKKKEAEYKKLLNQIKRGN